MYRRCQCSHVRNTHLLCLLRPLCRGQFMTDKLSDELQYSQALVQPLLACLQGLSKKVAELAAAGEGAVEALRLVLSNVQLVASIFYSLNSPGLTEVRVWGLQQLPATMPYLRLLLRLGARRPGIAAVVLAGRQQVECLLLLCTCRCRSLGTAWMPGWQSSTRT
jgi:hypothetical protein